MKMNKLYTTQEVAEQLKIKKTTVYDLIKRGELRATKVGKQLRISQDQLDEYLGIDTRAHTSPNKPASVPYITDMPDIAADSGILQMEYLLNNSGLIIGSQESTVVEMLRSHLEGTPGSLPLLHSYLNEYNSLYSLYNEKTHLALVNSFSTQNDVATPRFIRSMLPGMSITVLSICDCMLGLYIAKDNPCKISSHKDLCRSDIRIINREKGSISRILLDRILLQENVSSANLSGYKNECLSHMAVANNILSKKADVGIGDQALLASFPELHFVPLKKSRMYLVFPTFCRELPAFQAIETVLHSDMFNKSLAHFYKMADTSLQFPK